MKSRKYECGATQGTVTIYEVLKLFQYSSLSLAKKCDTTGSPKVGFNRYSE